MGACRRAGCIADILEEKKVDSELNFDVESL